MAPWCMRPTLPHLCIPSCRRISGLSLQRVGQLCTGLRSLHISDPGPLVDEPAIASLFPSFSSRDEGTGSHNRLATAHAPPHTHHRTRTRTRTRTRSIDKLQGTGHGGTLRSLVLDACGERLQDASLVRMAQLWSGLCALRLSECPDLSGIGPDAHLHSFFRLLSALTSCPGATCFRCICLRVGADSVGFAHLTRTEWVLLPLRPFPARPRTNPLISRPPRRDPEPHCRETCAHARTQHTRTHATHTHTRTRVHRRSI
jgi:hypothetical protein